MIPAVSGPATRGAHGAASSAWARRAARRLWAEVRLVGLSIWRGSLGIYSSNDWLPLLDELGNYGMKKWGDLFTDRQLVALTTFSDLVGEAMDQVRRDALSAGLAEDAIPLRDGGSSAMAYSESVSVYDRISV